MAMTCKRIGLDFHGVLNSNPDFFKEFCAFAKSRGAQIYIISGGPRETIIDFLARRQISYDKIWCIFDYFAARNKVKFMADGSFYVEDKEWNSAKGEYCRQNKICLQIDNSTVYGKYFSTPYCLYNETDKTGTINGKVINFNSSIAACWNKLGL